MCPNKMSLRAHVYIAVLIFCEKECSRYVLTVTGLTCFMYYRVSHPPTIILPLHNWEPKDEPTKEEEVGPLVEHIYEVRIIDVATRPHAASIEILMNLGYCLYLQLDKDTNINILTLAHHPDLIWEFITPVFVRVSGGDISLC